MPNGVGRVQERPVIAPASGSEGIESGGRHHRGPGSGWRHRNPLFGGAGLHGARYHAGTETHSLDTDLSQSRVGPVSLDIGAVHAIESLDAAPEKCADARPLR